MEHHSHHILSALFSALSPPNATDPVSDANHQPNPLAHTTNNTTNNNSPRNALLTLHLLFPHNLLAALDLLDRARLTRLLCPPLPPLYHVRPAVHHQSSSASSFSPHEVRLQAWSCSCPAFAFAAFPPPDRSPGDTPPMCPHLLACLLVERTTLFAAAIDERRVPVTELAAWAAGWG